MSTNLDHGSSGEAGLTSYSTLSSTVLKFTSDHQHSLTFNVMNDLRQSGEMCDIVLKVDSEASQPIHAHRLVLAGSSPYFRAMFTGGLAESNQQEIIIKEIDPEALCLLIDYFYTSKLTINESNVQNLFVASCLLQVDEVKRKCAQFLMSQLSPSNCLGMRALGSTYSCPALFTTADSIVKRQFVEVVGTEEFGLLPLEPLIEIIKSDNLDVKDEESIFNAIMNWVENETFPERRESLPKLIVHLRLGLLSGKFLDKISEKRLIKENEFCLNLVQKAKVRFRLLCRQENQSFKRRRNRAEIGGQSKKPKTEEIPILTGFDFGYEAEGIIHKMQDEQTGEEMVIMKWKGIDKTELVPLDQVRLKCPLILIDYLDSRDRFFSSELENTDSLADFYGSDSGSDSS